MQGGVTINPPFNLIYYYDYYALSRDTTINSLYNQQLIFVMIMEIGAHPHLRCSKLQVKQRLARDPIIQSRHTSLIPD
jgi:cobalamin biosynthesis protein CbiG